MPLHLRCADMRRSYVTLLDLVLAVGQPMRSRGLDAREVTGAQLEFVDPLAPMLPIGVGRGVNLKLAAVEALQIIAGESRSELVRRAAPTFTNVLVDPSDLDYGAYGPRLAYAIGDCLELLRDDPETRQAVASVWRPEDLEHRGDKPCTVFLQFMIRANENDERTLELYAYMRSQDVWLGVPYDVFTFSQLQHTMARELRLPAGRYVHNVTSLHLYESNVELARRVITQHDADAREPDNDLPLGVVSPGDESGFEVASYLLDDAEPEPTTSANDAERASNRWYVTQLGKIGQTTGL
jgi:thymidylate synthase